MFASKILMKRGLQKQCLCMLQRSFYSSGKHNSNKAINHNLSIKESEEKNSNKLGGMSSKYQVFRDEDSEVILDIYEDSNKYGDLLETEEEKDSFAGINLNRGVSGVYEIEDLVDLLHHENAQDIFVASVPKEIKYVNYICVVTGKSVKHMQSIAQFVRIVYKKKMHKTDLVPKLEGVNSKDWMALDLGNIALHIFSRDARIVYDLDCLWSVGPQYDDKYNQEDPVAEMLKKHSIFLQDLKPAS